MMYLSGTDVFRDIRAENEARLMYTEELTRELSRANVARLGVWIRTEGDAVTVWVRLRWAWWLALGLVHLAVMARIRYSARAVARRISVSPRHVRVYTCMEPECTSATKRDYRPQVDALKSTIREVIELTCCRVITGRESMVTRALVAAPHRDKIDEATAVVTYLAKSYAANVPNGRPLQAVFTSKV